MASNPSQGKFTKPSQHEEVQSTDYQSSDKSSSNTLKVLSCHSEVIRLWWSTVAALSSAFLLVRAVQI
ncbi:hypothetical protein Cfor_02308 [Coptotermes formosanus]|jgi:hypothetical protein|uniref:Uncharacterized protein n=1 Tax=Coptotermes formosanus TaxID=36987 RepID=A0A6L2P9J7_COPFO|nr:hypothetical protein Cfor_02308 [Coptotermes formosanus]